MAEKEELMQEVANMNLTGEYPEEPATVTTTVGEEVAPATTESIISEVLRLVQRLKQTLDNKLVAPNERVNRSRLREDALHGDVQGMRSVRPMDSPPSMTSLPNAVKLPKLSKSGWER